jgi:hypothetical protein
MTSSEVKEQRGTTNKQGLDGREVTRHAETAITAAAEQAKALVQAKFLVALNRPRNIEDARVRILEACRRPRFADMARYSKPVGGKQEVQGASIRFADEAVKIFGNADVTKSVLYEDDDQRIVKVTVTDLETNTSKSDDVTVKKTVERRKPRDGQEIIGKRENSYGDTVYLVRANDDEVNMKEANLCAKARRNLELQIIPQDIIEEAMDTAVQTMENRDAADPDAAKRRTIDAFARIGVRPSELEKYIGHSMGSISPAEVDDLRKVYQSINQGEASWKDFLANASDEVTAGDESTGSSKAASVREKIRERRQQKPEAEKPQEYVADVSGAHLPPEPSPDQEPPKENHSPDAGEMVEEESSCPIDACKDYKELLEAKTRTPRFMEKAIETAREKHGECGRVKEFGDIDHTDEIQCGLILTEYRRVHDRAKGK